MEVQNVLRKIYLVAKHPKNDTRNWLDGYAFNDDQLLDKGTQSSKGRERERETNQDKEFTVV